MTFTKQKLSRFKAAASDIFIVKKIRICINSVEEMEFLHEKRWSWQIMYIKKVVKFVEFDHYRKFYSLLMQ